MFYFKFISKYKLVICAFRNYNITNLDSGDRLLEIETWGWSLRLTLDKGGLPHSQLEKVKIKPIIKVTITK